MDSSSKNIKEIATDFLRLCVTPGKVSDAYRLYIGQDFRHHWPFCKEDTQSLMTAMEENVKKNPNIILEIQRALQDGDLVAVHSHIRQNQNDLGSSVVHIFRFNDNRIVEFWDIFLLVPADNVNKNDMF